MHMCDPALTTAHQLCQRGGTRLLMTTRDIQYLLALDKNTTTEQSLLVQQETRHLPTS
jgi:hypothetical protein